MTAPAIFRRFPALADRIPWTPLGSFPTPVERLALAGLEGEVWVKRDDLSGEPYGGNKVRKLEFLLAGASRRGVKRLVTAGALGSHHALATTVYGRALGFDVTLVLFPQPVTEHVRRVLLADHALGAELRYVPRMELVPAALRAVRFAHRREGAMIIPPGGSDATGTLGYVAGALELAEQIEAGSAPRPDAVYVAAGTLGTAAGLALGFALAGLEIRVQAIRITGRIVAHEGALARLVRQAARLLEAAGLNEPGLADRALRLLELRHDQVGPGYGRETEAGRRAAELLAGAGIGLDPTYTAKAAAGLLATLEARPGGVHLYWHTLSSREPIVAAAADERDLPDAFRRALGRS